MKGKQRLIYDNGIIVDADTGVVLGVEYVAHQRRSLEPLSVVNALSIYRYSRSTVERNVNRARAAVLLLSRYYRKRALHALACFEKLKGKLDFTKDHVTYRRSGVIVWVSAEFAELLGDVFRCARLPKHVLDDVLDYIKTCR